MRRRIYGDIYGDILYVPACLQDPVRLLEDCVKGAGPIQTEIWGDAIRNAEPAEQKGSVFSEYVQKAHRLSERETSKPGWFWEPSVIGERAWKVWLDLRWNTRQEQSHLAKPPRTDYFSAFGGIGRTSVAWQQHLLSTPGVHGTSP